MIIMQFWFLFGRFVVLNIFYSISDPISPFVITFVALFCRRILLYLYSSYSYNWPSISAIAFLFLYLIVTICLRPCLHVICLNVLCKVRVFSMNVFDFFAFSSTSIPCFHSQCYIGGCAVVGQKSTRKGQQQVGTYK